MNCYVKSNISVTFRCTIFISRQIIFFLYLYESFVKVSCSNCDSWCERDITGRKVFFDAWRWELGVEVVISRTRFFAFLNIKPTHIHMYYVSSTQWVFWYIRYWKAVNPTCKYSIKMFDEEPTKITLSSCKSRRRIFNEYFESEWVFLLFPLCYLMKRTSLFGTPWK